MNKWRNLTVPLVNKLLLRKNANWIKAGFLRKRIGSKTWRLVFGFDVHNTLSAIGSTVGSGSEKEI